MSLVFFHLPYLCLHSSFGSSPNIAAYIGRFPPSRRPLSSPSTSGTDENPYYFFNTRSPRGPAGSGRGSCRKLGGKSANKQARGLQICLIHGERIITLAENFALHLLLSQIRPIRGGAETTASECIAIRRRHARRIDTSHVIRAGTHWRRGEQVGCHPRHCGRRAAPMAKSY